MRAGLGVFAILFSLIAAMACGAAAIAADLDVPNTVFKSGADGAAVHLQSQLQCPLTVGDFHRISLHLYQPTGLDVSCDYQTASRDEITLYIALPPGMPQAGAPFATAKAAIEKRYPGATPLAAAELKSFVSKLDWQQLTYRVSEVTRTGVWMTQLAGWNVEFRATYPARDVDSTLAALTELSSVIEKTAAAHIQACALLPPTPRNGKKIVDESRFPVLQVSGMMAAEAFASDPKWVDAANWCVLRAVKIAGQDFLMWRNAVRGTDGVINRLTPLRPNDNLAVYGITDTFWPKMVKTGARTGTVYDVVLNTDDALILAGVYEGLPPLPLLLPFAQERRAFAYYATFDKKTGKMTVYRAPN